MNAIFATDDRVNLFDAVTPERARIAAKLRLMELGHRFNNSATVAEDYAVENLLAGRPAFWSQSRGYSDATAGIFLETVCQLASIRGAIDECEHFYKNSSTNWRNVALLDQLLPLNGEAVRELMRAYKAAGTFRDADELMNRTARHEPAERRVA